MLVSRHSIIAKTFYKQWWFAPVPSARRPSGWTPNARRCGSRAMPASCTRRCTRSDSPTSLTRRAGTTTSRYTGTTSMNVSLISLLLLSSPSLLLLSHLLFLLLLLLLSPSPTPPPIITNPLHATSAQSEFWGPWGVQPQQRSPIQPLQQVNINT